MFVSPKENNPTDKSQDFIYKEIIQFIYQPFNYQNKG